MREGIVPQTMCLGWCKGRARAETCVDISEGEGCSLSPLCSIIVIAERIVVPFQCRRIHLNEHYSENKIPLVSRHIILQPKKKH